MIILSPELLAQDNPFMPPTYSTPEAASLAKSINHPVNMNTGVPEISVPLHSVDIGGLILPITLNYHAGGFKINELAGRYGLGWSLSCDLQITRSINGGDDLLSSGYLNSNALYDLSENQRNYQLATGGIDGLPDRFYYSLLTKSGSFFFQRSNAGSNYAIISEPYEDIKIEYDKTNGIFKITDTDGTVYQYGGSTHTDIPKKRGLEFFDDNITAWKCTSITNKNKGIDIKFNYLAKPKELRISSDDDYIEYWKKRRTSMRDGNSKGETFPSTNPSFSNYDYALNSAHKIVGEYYKIHRAGKQTELHIVYFNDKTKLLEKKVLYEQTRPTLGRGNYVKGLALSSIEYRGGMIKFRKSERLNSIEILDSKLNIIKKIDFHQSYTYNAAGKNYHGLYYLDLDTEDNKELDLTNKEYKGTNYLDSIQIKGKDNLVYDKFAFEYYKKECFGNHLQNKDAWGGFNMSTEAIRPESKTSAIPNIKQTFSYSAFNYSPDLDWTFTLGDNPQNYRPEAPDEASMQTGILKRIHYATGGYVHFDYETNRYEEPVYNENSEGRTTVMFAGGLRIKTINYFDGNSNTPIKQKYYRYGEYEEGVGRVLKGATRVDYFNEPSYTYGYFTPFIYTQSISYNIPNTDGNPCSEIKYTYKPTSSKDLTYESGSPVYYTKVTEYNSDMGEETGKTVYSYYPPNEFNYDVMYINDFITMGNIPHIKPKWSTGMLRSVTEYSYERQKYYLQHQKEYFYKKSDKGALIAKCAYIQNYYQAINASTYLKANAPDDIRDLHSYNFGKYEIPMGKMLIEKEIEKWGYDTITVTQETIYEYEKNYVQPSRITTTKSDGNTIITSLRYPYHFSSISPYDVMVANNNISPVIEKSISSKYQERKEFTDYKSIDVNSKTLIVPGSIRRSYKGGSPQTELTFDQYDEYGNLLQMRGRDNITKSYLWGYNSRLLLAEITGADYNTVKNTVTLSTIQNPTSESMLRAELSKLQSSSSIPFATTLTYDNNLPVIKSISTPNKVNTYYDYDPFGRFTSQSDDNLSVISDIQYSLTGFKEKIWGDPQKKHVKSPKMESFNFHRNEADDGTIGLFNYIDHGAYSPRISNGSIWSYGNDDVPNPNDYDDYIVGSQGGDAIYYKKADLAKILIRVPYHTYGKSLQYDYANNFDLKVPIHIDFIQDEHIVATKIFRVEDYKQAKTMEFYIPAGEYKIAFRFRPYNGAILVPYMDNQNKNAYLRSGNSIYVSGGVSYDLSFIRQ